MRTVEDSFEEENLIFLELFNKSTAQVSDENPTEFTPAGPTFSLWGLIYSWQVRSNTTIRSFSSSHGPFLSVSFSHLLISESWTENGRWLFLYTSIYITCRNLHSIYCQYVTQRFLASALGSIEIWRKCFSLIHFNQYSLNNFSLPLLSSI